jgi:hypothetical protein
VAAAPPEGSVPKYVWQLALRGAAGLRNGEGQFWERLYGDFLTHSGVAGEAAMGAVMHLSRKNRQALPLVEFVGTMSPVKEIEDMPHRRAVRFLAGHIRDNWGRPGGGRRAPTEGQARRLASDLYHVSRIFRIPLTFLCSSARADWARGGPWPGTMQAYSGALAVSGLVSRSARLWDPSSPSICDFYELAQPGSQAYRDAYSIRQEKASLARSAAAEQAAMEQAAVEQAARAS